MRFRLRFSLRSFLLAIALVAAALGIWSSRTLDQKENVRVLRGAGYDVVYDVDLPRDDWARRGAQQWLVSRLGRDWAAVPLRVGAEGRCLYLEDLTKLARLSWVDRVNLAGSTAADDCLAVLSRMPQLAQLNLDSTLVTDEGLPRLHAHPSLRNVVLGSTLVTPSAVEEFRRQNSRCVVVVRGQQSLQSAESRRFSHLKAERAPTSTEQAEFDLAIAILRSTDAFEQIMLAAKAHPEWYANKPEVGTPEFEKWKNSYKGVAPGGYEEELKILGQLGLDDGIPDLERFARDTALYEGQRWRAVRSLGFIADRRVIPIFIDLLDDPSDMVAREAANRLRLTTGQDFVEEHNWYPDPQHESRRALIARWQQFWKENHDVIRPRRAANFDNDTF